MAQANVYLRGTCKWAKIKEPVENYDKKGYSWTLDLFPDDSSWQVFEKAGLQLKKREDKKDGKIYITLKRPTKKMIKGSVQELTPPTVLDHNGNAFSGDIGNGSTVVCKLHVYDSMRGKGHTLVSIQVEDLVVYEKPETLVADDVVPF